MYRRAVTYAAKMVAGAGSLQLGAAAVALTDKQLNKKPDWYKKEVLALEDSLKRLSTYAYIESEEVLNTAEENFNR
jgi:putative NADH-flavin reductase